MTSGPLIGSPVWIYRMNKRRSELGFIAIGNAYVPRKSAISANARREASLWMSFFSHEWG